MHVDGDNVNTIRVTHSNITTSAYGLMVVIDPSAPRNVAGPRS